MLGSATYVAGYSGTPLIAKLGLKPPIHVLVVDAPPEYRKWLGELPDGVALTSSRTGQIEAAHAFVSRRAALEMLLGKFRRQLHARGFVWISWPKKASGVATDITEDTIRQVAFAARVRGRKGLRSQRCLVRPEACHSERGAEVMEMRTSFTTAGATVLTAGALLVAGASAQTLSGEALVAALRGGGHVIVMRHASSPRQVPDKQAANADNTTLERQLDEAGRNGAAAMGEALRRLKIPIGDVLTSPTYRARETVKHAQLADPKPAEELGDGGQSMQAAAGAQGAWLQKKVAELPRGTNTLMVTHMPNISRAFPDLTNVSDGEALVFGADGKGGARLVGRIKIEEWPSL